MVYKPLYDDKPYDIIDKFPHIDDIKQGLRNLNKITEKQDLNDLLLKITKIREYYIKESGLTNMFKDSVAKPFERDYQKVIDKINELFPNSDLTLTNNEPQHHEGKEEEIVEKDVEIVEKEVEKKEDEDKYNQILYISDEDIVNDLQMYESEYPIMTFEEYTKCLEIWYESDDISMIYDEFELELGEDFPNDNGEITGLYYLPYPTKFVIHSAKMALELGKEDIVRYTNFLCEWMRRKIEQMAGSSLNKIYYK